MDVSAVIHPPFREFISVKLRFEDLQPLCDAMSGADIVNWYLDPDMIMTVNARTSPSITRSMGFRVQAFASPLRSLDVIHDASKHAFRVSLSDAVALSKMFPRADVLVFRVKDDIATVTDSVAFVEVGRVRAKLMLRAATSASGGYEFVLKRAYLGNVLSLMSMQEPAVSFLQVSFDPSNCTVQVRNAAGSATMNPAVVMGCVRM